jgi:predicted nuclease of predicted toxin-antitoxin system
VLIDENLPRSLCQRLSQINAIHATELGSRLSDEELWTKARKAGWDIMTKDSDFFDRLHLEGPPPRVLWIRTGNLRRHALEALIERNWPRMLSMLDTSYLIELHSDRIECVFHVEGSGRS